MIKSKEVRDEETKDFYYDPMSFPIEQLNFTQVPVEYEVTATDIHRVDLLIYRYYGSVEFDDLLLWVNDVPFAYDMQEGDVLRFPGKRDLESFYSTFSE